MAPRVEVIAARTQALILLLAVSVIWVGASQLVRTLFTSGSLHAAVPWSLTYVNVAEFMLLLPMQAAYEAYRGTWSDWRGAARAASLVCPVWYVAQGSYNASLSSTSVSSSTMLSTTSCVFTFLLSLCIRGGERDRDSASRLWKRALGVACVVAGAAMVTADDVGHKGSSTAGDALALLSAAAYACYTTMIAKLVPAKASMNAFFGLIGLFTSIAMFPWVDGLWAAGVEDVSSLTTVRPPFTVSPLVLILLKGLLDNVLSDLLWARAVKLTSATLGTVALSLTIPLALASDALMGQTSLDGTTAAGAVLIVAGFVCAVLAEG